MLGQTSAETNTVSPLLPTIKIGGNDIANLGPGPMPSSAGSLAASLNMMPIDEARLAQWETPTTYRPTLNPTPGDDLFSTNALAQDFMRSSMTDSARALDPAAAEMTSTTDALTGEGFATAFSQDDILAPQSQRGARYIKGTLRANRFSVNLNEALTIISGNGNVDYGRGGNDFLDLSNISSRSVVEWSPAESKGVLFNTGNGTRVFDSLKFSNGSQILFEGLDQVKFSDRLLDLSVDPNDPGFRQQWNLHMMGVQNAWRFTQGSSKILVGVQDSGLGYSSTSQNFHPDLGRPLYLRDNVVDDFFRNVPGQRARKTSSHGTSVHSIIGAASNNGFGMSGINWKSNVFNIDVLDANAGDLNLAQAAQSMINAANRQGQKLVVNMSLGGGPLSRDFASLVARNQHNALFVVAAGNDGQSSLANPASLARQFSNVIAVGASWGTQDRKGRATNPGDRIQYRYNDGRDWGSNFGQGLSLMGPSEVLAAKATPSGSGASFSWVSDFHGTSAAAPNVAGVASLVWSVNPMLSAGQVHKIMAETAYDLGAVGYDLVTGAGFVNADAAVRRAMAIGRTARAASPFASTVGAMAQFSSQFSSPVAAHAAESAMDSLEASPPSIDRVNPIAIAPSLPSQLESHHPFTAPLTTPLHWQNTDNLSALSPNAEDFSTDISTDIAVAKRATAAPIAEGSQPWSAQRPLSDILNPTLEFVV